MRRARVHRLLAVTVLLAVGAAACSGGEQGADEAGGSGALQAGGGQAASEIDLSGVQLSVGSKEFAEQLVLGQIAVLALRAAGAEVTDRTGLTGTEGTREALDSGEIDLYWEYTGTGWITILGNDEAVEGAQEQFEAVREADAANGIVWVAPPADADNTYAIAANSEAVEEFGVESISDYAAVAADDPEAATLCSAEEFLRRDDGLPGLERAYGFDLPDDGVVALDLAPVYTEVGAGQRCDFAVVFATDGQIVANDLTVLEDDRSFFPAYNVAMTMRAEVYDEHAEAYDQLWGSILPLLTTATLTELNARLAVDGEPAADIAREFLAENGIIPA